jgi:hypothetical protein
MMKLTEWLGDFPNKEESSHSNGSVGNGELLK